MSSALRTDFSYSLVVTAAGWLRPGMYSGRRHQASPRLEGLQCQHLCRVGWIIAAFMATQSQVWLELE